MIHRPCQKNWFMIPWGIRHTSGSTMWESCTDSSKTVFCHLFQELKCIKPAGLIMKLMRLRTHTVHKAKLPNTVGDEKLKQIHHRGKLHIFFYRNSNYIKLTSHAGHCSYAVFILRLEVCVLYHQQKWWCARLMHTSGLCYENTDNSC